MCPHAQMVRTIRCVLVHGHVLLRQGLRRLLEDQPDICVEAEAASAAEASQKVLQHRPDVVIADAEIFASGGDPIEQSIRQGSPNSKVLLLTQNEEDNRAGAAAKRTRLAARQTSATELMELVRRTATGEQSIPREERAKELAEFPLEEVVSRRRVLTTREREVLKLLAEGRTVRSAAGVLGLSVKTVDAHKFNLMRKLGIHNKAELVMWAIQRRVVKLPVNY